MSAAQQLLCATGTASPNVWAIEQNQNNDNLPDTAGSHHDCAPAGWYGPGTGGHPNGNPAALHAFCAAQTGAGTPCQNGAMTELYNSRGLNTVIGQGNAFPVPTIFNGYVYIGTGPLQGTDGEIDVFGICNGHCKN